ncbi:ZIP family metal transporter [Thalassoroseus pseudoceratinae]|uniref:ZIP family metal transporter n=1 Tax=Thalassoroseus pseudoceratinae TaxID=2713176 RepID=UPI001422E3B4|nr:divalent cation transporter [Thalassoroseus pseudoceratinae]
MTLVLIYSFVAGLSMLVGGVLARYSSLPSKRFDGVILHAVTAFGGGALLAAIALVLVPEATEQLAAWQFGLAFGGGAAAFMELDRRLQNQGGTGAQVVAMLSDFLPEAIALGAAFARGDSSGPLLAMLIALQNVPEGFNAYRELESVMRARKALLILFALVWLGPLSAGVGYLVLVDYPDIVAYVMSFAAGGILYLIFQDIAPEAKLTNHWAPPLGAVAGFLLGTLGDYMVH